MIKFCQLCIVGTLVGPFPLITMKKFFGPLSLKRKTLWVQSANGPGPAISKNTLYGLKSPKTQSDNNRLLLSHTRHGGKASCWRRLTGEPCRYVEEPALRNHDSNEVTDWAERATGETNPNSEPSLDQSTFSGFNFFFKFLNYVFLSYFWIKFSSIFLSCFFFALGAYWVEFNFAFVTVIIWFN